MSTVRCPDARPPCSQIILSVYQTQLFHDCQMFTLEMEGLYLRFLPDP